MSNKKQRFLTVAPFKCEWNEDLRFREAGRGCVAFEAFAQNDVTLVFREQVGSQQYHYKMDNSPNYTVILGSHRNRRLKIEVNGETVVDVAGIGLCCSSSFQSYWISIYDGLITIGIGKCPFQNIVFQWLDSKPNCSVQYVGLSSWDKHVGYRNIIILPLTQHLSNLWSQVGYKDFETEEDMECELLNIDDGHFKCGLMSILEKWDFSDIVFLVGVERKAVPAHKVILNAHGDFRFSCSDNNVIHLPSTEYPILHAFLEYIYTGETRVVESQLGSLRDLSVQFHVLSLIKQCEEITGRFKMNKKLFDFGKKVELSSSSFNHHQCGIFPWEIPAVRNLKQSLATGEHTDVEIYVEGHGLVAQSHRIILSLWSAPFAKMFTNGMIETNSSHVSFRDVSAEAFSIMIRFMYSGELEINGEKNGHFLIALLLLADQFGITYLQRECCKYLLDCLSEDTACSILLAIESVPSCKMVEEACMKNFSMHFDYCTTANVNFVFLDETTFKEILQHDDMTVTSEERVLDAILMWCMQASEICGWTVVDELLNSSTLEQLFGDRILSLDKFLPLVRFPLMPHHLLQKVFPSRILNSNFSVRFQYRRSSFRELQYICDGDNNGVIYYAGTSYGEHQWVNPFLAKKITITASSPACRYTDPKALVSRAYQATSFAGPRVEGGRTCTWWMVDIGQDHQLMCNYYTFRQDGSTTFPRSWAFQGSMDEEHWTDLRVHENDRTICRPGQFASWQVLAPNSLLPFRFFRVILTAPAACDSNTWNLCICFIEIYGFFH
ncbi:BTB/POZ domain-containing protein [Apostasia shenzhenica]|uniref:BTB/POZ domain-containing protein n=1 Tax=Apostasia shenzhenica TaxID=1088818 RepID=A0A2H9ZSD3_9ASPA|nr:BTB/POZ domain-containing protein [Apostasia shenzhenica]